ncbi:8-oxo-dGTP pyrophosphatase MutT (NUDIX family) [Kribbella aluminosa]|uniref:8-oxo-dGTP pyrophosphatase MutT (NUDIX family) n=1 Tax=Kribbella aluminosa TaxID=416017 RepID=A0ABS4UET6_9ACTN|nr:NUDIX domain-containing protein [Kribbella aluminosa]MBP2350137.1 8-oxo-dGTP pyrophosphatase MutT (NUDIX family) [Kribbella aluminosa]
MVRQAVKLLLLDDHDRLLLIQSHNPHTHATWWYPVGGGIEPGESLQQAATREAYEETGLRDLPAGTRVWWRDHTYEHDDQRYDVHEEWLLHRVDHFDPSPAELSPYESRTILTFDWWHAHELEATHDTVFPPNLGRLLTTLLTDGIPSTPVDIRP